MPLLQLATGVIGLVGAVYLVLIAVDSRPIADDITVFVTVPHEGLWTYVHGWWVTYSGRFSEFVVIWVTARLFGTSAVAVTNLAMLLLLWVAILTSIRTSVRLTRVAVTAVETQLLAILATLAVLAGAPSLFDTVGWYSSLGYPMALAAAILTAPLCVRLMSGATHPVRAALLLATAGFLTAGSHEIVGVLEALAALLALLMLHVTYPDRRRRNATALLGLASGPAIGTALNVFSPGSGRRGTLQHAHVSLAAAAHTAWHNLGFFYRDVHGGVFLMALATGVLGWRLLGAALRRRGLLWLAVWSGFLIVMPWLVTSVLTAWGGSTESGDRSPFRTAYLFTGLAAIGLSMLVLAALCVVASRVRGSHARGVWRASLAILLLAAGGIVGLAHRAAPIITAERMRIRAVDQRAGSVRDQLAGRRSTIRMTPAPLLSVYTQALDLSFAAPQRQRAWIVRSLRAFYRIPPQDSVRIVERQARDYCLPNVAASWVGVESCQELRRH